MNEQSKETILFVDDEDSILEIDSEFFQHKGYKVFTAVNGHEALEIFRTREIDCCVTDMNMPEMDGLELAERIRQMDMALPVVMVTGVPYSDDTFQTIKNDVVDFLTKPVNMEHLEMCVRRILYKRLLFIKNLLLKEEIRSKDHLEALNHGFSNHQRIGSPKQIVVKYLSDFSMSHYNNV